MPPPPVRICSPGVTITLPRLGGAPKLEAGAACPTTESGSAATRSAPAARRYEAEPLPAPAGSPKVQLAEILPLLVKPSLSDDSKMRLPAARSVRLTGAPSAAFQPARSQVCWPTLLSRVRSPLLEAVTGLSISMPGRTCTFESPARFAGNVAMLWVKLCASVNNSPDKSATSQEPPVPQPASMLPRSDAA